MQQAQHALQMEENSKFLIQFLLLCIFVIIKIHATQNISARESTTAACYIKQ
jgi:hypothetical protein